MVWGECGDVMTSLLCSLPLRGVAIILDTGKFVTLSFSPFCAENAISRVVADWTELGTQQCPYISFWLKVTSEHLWDDQLPPRRLGNRLGQATSH